MQFVARQFARSRPTLRPTCRILVGPRPSQFLSSRTIVTKKYTSQHECINFDDLTGIGIVSLTEYAQKSLGDVVFVELPAVGTKVKQGDQIGAVESVKAASDIYAPVTGLIAEINESLHAEPSLLNKSPEHKGWLCKIKLSDPSEVENLMEERAYLAFCES